MEEKEDTNTTAKNMTAIQNDVRTIGQYELGKTIGEGTFGKVKLGTHTLTSEKVRVFSCHF